MYQRVAAALLLGMDNNWAGLVPRAVRRDLERARYVLAHDPLLTAERREALAGHVRWMLRLIATGDAGIAAAVRRTAEAASALGACHEGTPRRDAILALTHLCELLDQHRVVAATAALPTVARQVHWLVDGMSAADCEHITRSLVPGRRKPMLRPLAVSYRRRKQLLWGITYAPDALPALAG